MPGGRDITGADVRAAARAAGADGEALRTAVLPDDVFAGYEELAAAAPPALLGMSPGAHAALFSPLFGEFE